MNEGQFSAENSPGYHLTYQMDLQPPKKKNNFRERRKHLHHSSLNCKVSFRHPHLTYSHLVSHT